MAKRPHGYGLSAEISRKIREKYDLAVEVKVRRWIEGCIGESLFTDVESHEAVGVERIHQALKDGKVLIRVMNKLRPEKPIKINEKGPVYFQMENISKFLSAAYDYGMKKQDSFEVADLYEKGNMTQVLCSIVSLSRVAQKNGYTGESIVPKESDSNVRQFSDEVLQAGQTIIGLQMGSNKGANQHGLNFGKSRSIND